MIFAPRIFCNFFRLAPAIFIAAAFLAVFFSPVGEVVVREGVIAGRTGGFEIAGAAAILVAANFILSIFFRRREKLLAGWLEAANFILSLGVLIAVASHFYF